MAILAVLQTASLVWTLVLAAALVSYLLWMFKRTRMLEHLYRMLGRVHQELWIIAPLGIMAWAVRDFNGGDWFQLFIDMLSLFNWWYYRNWPSENRWKKRGRKAKQVVAERAGRLVVVPATGGA